jgi:hypothetical protein
LLEKGDLTSKDESLTSYTHISLDLLLLSKEEKFFIVVLNVLLKVYKKETVKVNNLLLKPSIA